MKKLLILLVMLSLVVFAFAQEADEDYTAVDQGAEDSVSTKKEKKFEFDLEITLGIPIHWTDAKDHPDDGKDKYVSEALAAGIALNFNFNKKIGLFLDTDFAFIRFVGNSSADTGTYHGYDGLFEFNATLGPVIYLYSGNFLRIPLGLGLHYYYFCGPDYWGDATGAMGARNWYEATDHQFGLGAYLGLQFHFNKSLYILARTNVEFDFMRYHKVNVNGTSDSEFEFITALHVKPTFGLGIKW